MKLEKKHFFRSVCAIVIVALATCLFYIMWYGFVSENNITGFLLGWGNIAMAILLYIGLFSAIGKWMGAFRIGVDRKATIMASVALAIFVTDFIEIFVSMAITNRFRFFPTLLLRFLLLGIVQIAILCLLTIPMVNIYRKKFPPLNMLEIYGEYEHGLNVKINNIRYKYNIVDTIDYRETSIEEIKNRIEKVDAVVISDIPAHEKNQILKLCVDREKRVYFIPKISDVIVHYADELNLIDTPLFLVRKVGIRFFEGIIKRVFDVLVSLFSLVLFSPIFIVTALAIKLEDGGPVFFKQERVTFGDNRFMIFKFRSMIVDAEKDGRPHPAGEKDPRITKVGHVIRSCRIDELPQLLNILKGEMSIVGPRPERWEHVEKYSNQIPEFSFRHKVKGGLTGYAQVYGKYNTSALDKLKMDLMYIMNNSLLLDLQIIFETIKILLRKESTEGFEEERIQEMHDTGR